MIKLIGIAGSIADQSYNRQLIKFIRDHYSDLFELEVLDISNVPLFNQDDAELSFEEPIHTINRKILQADGVIIATPEHNRTVPSPLKSLLDWLSFKIHPLRNKPVMIVGTSYYDQGTSRSQLHLRQILEAPGIDALVMPGNEVLIGEAKEAFDEEGQLKDQGTIDFLRKSLEKFMRYVDVVEVLNEKPEPEPEDLFATGKTDTTVEGIALDDPEWLEKAADQVHAVSRDTYVKLDHGLLTVDQLNGLLNSLPLDITYSDDNNQVLYYSDKQSESETFAKRDTTQIGDSIGAIYPEQAHANLSWIIAQLRAGNLPGVHIHVPTKEDDYLVHNYVAMRDEDGGYRGVNEYVTNLQPIVEWYLEQTGQELTGGNAKWAIDSQNTDITTGASDHAVQEEQPPHEVTSDKQDDDTDSLSGASENN